MPTKKTQTVTATTSLTPATTTSTQPRKGKTRNRKPAERAIIYAGLVGNLTREAVCDLLREAGFPDIKESSWKVLAREYLPVFTKNPSEIGSNIYRPRQISDL